MDGLMFLLALLAIGCASLLLVECIDRHAEQHPGYVNGFARLMGEEPGGHVQLLCGACHEPLPFHHEGCSQLDRWDAPPPRPTTTRETRA